MKPFGIAAGRVQLTSGMIKETGKNVERCYVVLAIALLSSLSKTSDRKHFINAGRPVKLCHILWSF